MKKLFFSVFALSALILSACSGGGDDEPVSTPAAESSETTPAQSSDAGGDTSAAADDSSAAGDNSSDEGSGSSQDTETKKTLYFREASWWNGGTVKNYVSLDDSGFNANQIWDFSVLEEMTYVSTTREGINSYYNIYKIEIDNFSSYSTVRFLRAGLDDHLALSSWGAWTEAVATTQFANKDLYDIHACNKPAAWEDGAPEGASRQVTGTAGTYNASDYVSVATKNVKFTVTGCPNDAGAVYLAGNYNNWY